MDPCSTRAMLALDPGEELPGRVRRRSTPTSEFAAVPGDEAGAAAAAQAAALVCHARRRTLAVVDARPLVYVYSEPTNSPTSSERSVLAYRLPVTSPAPETVRKPPPHTLLSPVLRWLMLPLVLVAAALVALYFIEEERPTLRVFLLQGLVHGVLLCYFASALFLDSRSLLDRFAKGIVPLMTCALEQGDLLLSAEARLRYLQETVLSARSIVTHMAEDVEADAADFDPLHYVRLEMTAHEHVSDGHIIVDDLGTILWCNEALSRYFSYDHGSLVSENIRLLMPHPYNTAHDRLMRQYDPECTMKKIVGCTRHLPVVDRNGRHSQVYLTIEERRDPLDDSHHIFLAKMVWSREPELHVTLQEHVTAGMSMLEACEAIHTHWDHFLLINGRGTILFANDGICSLLRWRKDDLQGKNISVLMNPEVGEGHDALLDQYLRRVEESQAAGTGVPASTVVAKGRDLYARCHGGEYVRIWLTVHRVEALSGAAADCCFVGTMVYIQGQEYHSHSPRRPRRQTSRHSISSAPKSPRTARMELYRANSSGPNSAAGSAMGGGSRRLSTFARTHRPTQMLNVAQKRCTVVAFDIRAEGGLRAETLAAEYTRFAALLTASCNRNNAVIHLPLGDRVFVSLNLTHSCISQRSAAVLMMQQVLQGFDEPGGSSGAELRAAAACGEALCATYNRVPLLIGEMVDLCACMLAAACEAGVLYGVIDPTLYEELQYTYECRLINVVTLHPRPGPARRVPLYELHSLKEHDENEWMYQIQAQQKKDPLATWRACWDHLEGVTPASPRQARVGPVVPAYDQALVCLQQHITEATDAGEPDEPALWLRRVLEQRRAAGAPAAPPAAQVFGRLRCVVHYGLAEPPGEGPPPGPPPFRWNQ